LVAPRPESRQAGKRAEVITVIRSVDDLPEIEGFVRGQCHVYPRPELGWSLPYRTEGGLVATVYVYPSLEGGGEAADLRALAAAEFARAIQEIHKYVAQGQGLQVTLLKESPARFKASEIDPRAHQQAFLMRDDNGSFFSELVLLESDGQFIKIRASYAPFPLYHRRQRPYLDKFVRGIFLAPQGLLLSPRDADSL
jgi:hypothetical protein